MADFMTKDPSIPTSWDKEGCDPFLDIQNLMRDARGEPQLKTLHVPAMCKVCGRQIHKLEQAWQECKTITMCCGQPVNQYFHACLECHELVDTTTQTA